MGKIKLALALILFLMLLHPVGAREEMRVVPAQEILDKIERGEPVEYDHVIVEGDLDLGRLELPDEHSNKTIMGDLFIAENKPLVSSSIKISDAIINGHISFINTIFSNPVCFTASTFNGNAHFMGSTFNMGAYFYESAFRSDADFGNSVFNDTAFFWESKFNSTAYFWNSVFIGDAIFKLSAFNGNAHFTLSAFKSEADFSYSAFKGNAYFMGSTFNISNFYSAEFNQEASFMDSDFSNFTMFGGSHFKEDAFFEGAFFDGPLFLTYSRYDRLFIRWKNINYLEYNESAYLTLLENFRKLGYLEDYDACYYEYRRLHRDQPWSGRYHALHPAEEWLRKKIDLGLQAFYGYGKKPIWPLLWSAGTILLFGLIWRRAGVDGGRGRGGIFERFSPGGEKKEKISHKEQLRALGGAMLFSATLFLSGTRLFVDPPAMPKLEGWLAAHARGFFIAERVLGAFFSILFFLAVSGTVVR